MNGAMLARRVVALIEQRRINISTEQSAHDSVQAALEADGLDVHREVRMGLRDRVDLMVKDVAIEVKVKASSRRSVLRQLERYAEHDAVAAIVLVTGMAWPAMEKVKGKRLFVASLAWGWI